MTAHEDDITLTGAVTRLNETAQALSDVLVQVDRSQQLLVTLQRSTTANTKALTHTSTKEELLDEVERLVRVHKRERRRTRAIIAGTTILSLTLIGLSAWGFQQFKDSRHETNVAYSKVVEDSCLQRGVAWGAMQEWIATQKALETANTSIPPAFKAKRIAALDELLKSFPDVDCEPLGTGLAGWVIPGIGLNLPSPNVVSGIN